VADGDKGVVLVGSNLAGRDHEREIAELLQAHRLSTPAERVVSCKSDAELVLAQGRRCDTVFHALAMDQAQIEDTGTHAWGDRACIGLAFLNEDIGKSAFEDWEQ
jgi:hypothetical protein